MYPPQLSTSPTHFLLQTYTLIHIFASLNYLIVVPALECDVSCPVLSLYFASWPFSENLWKKIPLERTGHYLVFIIRRTPWSQVPDQAPTPPRPGLGHTTRVCGAHWYPSNASTNLCVHTPKNIRSIYWRIQMPPPWLEGGIPVWSPFSTLWGRGNYIWSHLHQPYCVAGHVDGLPISVEATNNHCVVGHIVSRNQ